MSNRERRPAPDLEPVLGVLVQPLRDRLDETGLSQARLAARLRCDRSRVSRALSGREVPPRHLIERIAEELGGDTVKARRQWDRADRIRRQASACRAGGGPPDDLDRYADLLRALRDLLRGRGISQRQVVQRDLSGRLRRSTVGAVLRGERTAQRDVVVAIVRACGVSDTAVAAWATAWSRLGRPHQEEQHRRRREGYERRTYAEMMGWG
jgi:transcriptional regulator with XRE-family HTH domain